MKTLFCVIFTLAFFEIASAQKIQTDSPERSQKIFKNRSAISYIFVPIRVRMEDFTQLVSKNLPESYSGRIYDIEDGEYTIHLDRLEYFAANNKLFFKVGYDKGIASGVLGVTVAGKTAGVSANINSLKGEITLYPNFQVKGYDLSTDLKMSNTLDHAEMQACKYIGWPINRNMCSLSMPVTSMVDESIEEQINDSKYKIERSIQSELDKLNLERTVSRVWRGFYKNTALDTSSVNLWLLTRPTRVFMSAPEYTLDYIQLGFGVNLATKIDSSEEAFTRKPLPEPLTSDRKKGYFKFNAPGFVSYRYLEEALNKKFRNHTIYYQKKRFLKVKEIKVYGSNDDKLVVALRVDGLAKTVRKARGWIYVEADIELIEEDYSLRVKSYDLNAETNNFLLNNGLEIMANKTHYKKFLTELKYDLKPELAGFQNKIDAQLKKGFKTDYGSITGSLSDMSFADFIMTKNGIAIKATLLGQIDPFYIDVNKLN